MVDGCTKVLLTFDVELFFGNNSGTLEHCILRPTRRILAELKRHSASATFFIDASFVHYLRSNHLTADLREMEALVKEIEEANSEIALHIHPHWTDARSLESGYCFSKMDNYSVATYSGSFYEHCIAGHDVLAAWYTSSPIRTFRAGGYCSQPFSSIEQLFHNTDILADSSVVPGLRVVTPPFALDYSHVVQTSPYNFSEDNTVPVPQGRYYELPVSSFLVSGKRRAIEKFKRIWRRDVQYGDGQGLRFGSTVASRLSASRKVVTLDDASFSEVTGALSGRRYANVVSHPKNFTENSLSVMGRILSSSKYVFAKCSDAI